MSDIKGNPLLAFFGLDGANASATLKWVLPILALPLLGMAGLSYALSLFVEIPLSGHLVAIGEGAALERAGHLSSEDNGRRCLALALLESMGKAARPARTALLELLKDDDLLIRARVVSALGRCGLEPRQTAEILLSAYRQEARKAPPVEALKPGSRLHDLGVTTVEA